MAAGLRRPALLLDRRGRPRPEQSLHRLGRHGREQQPTFRRLRRWGLSVGRRREVMEECGPQKVGAHRPDPDRPEELVHHLRRGAGTALVGGRRTGSLQIHRRRDHLEPDAEDAERAHRRGRCGHGPARCQRAVCGIVPTPPACVDPDQRRPGFGPAQVDRWRRNVEAAQERTSVGRSGEDRGRRFSR